MKNALLYIARVIAKIYGFELKPIDAQFADKSGRLYKWASMNMDGDYDIMVYTNNGWKRTWFDSIDHLTNIKDC